MSRPTTRSKNKRHKPGDNVDTTSELLRKIHLTGEITQDDISMLYGIWKPVCQGCRVNSKDNPNCFCGLIPPPNGTRKCGLWQKTSEILQSLGPDPNTDLRQSENSPVGLTNLGATCYANSILQCLYMNKSFREGIFSAEHGLLERYAVLGQLARLFVQLRASKRAFIDSSPFVKTLELDNGVQQDSHEFLTLLLSLLERCLSHSGVSVARTIVQDLFRGSVSNVTTCSQCGKDSEASSNLEDFYELELNVKGLKSLDESLDDYLSVEELHGDNQYFCESCNTRVNASRSIKLRTLPRVLNFHLKRCVFVPRTTTKKKITSIFSFPGELDMGKRIYEPNQVESVYDLTSVLIHKGTAVNSGHYIAHVKDEKTGQWWEFDDEHVSDLGRHPFGESSSNSNSKPVKTDPVVNTSRTEQKSAVVANGDHKDVQESHEPTSGSHVEIFSSSDAYMLTYNLRCSRKDSSYDSVVCDTDHKDIGEIVSLQDGISLPSHLWEEVKILNASYDDACQHYKLKKETEVNCLSERRQEVRSVLSDTPVRSLDEPFCWISADWLRQWADNVTALTLDNSSIQCLHGKVPVSKVGSMKRISTKAWDRLCSKYDGGPKLSGDDHCTVCLIDGARTLVSADGYREHRTSVKQIVEDVLAGRCEDGSYFISRAWLQQWLKRKILDAPSEADAGPTASIRCPHGELMPEQAAGAKRVLVPENVWLFLHQDAITANPEDYLGCSVFPSDSGQCPLCSEELSEVACMEDSLRVVRLRQRQNHEKLATGKSVPLSLDCKYFLVPSSWLLMWKNYINATGKNAASSVKPETLDGIIDSLKCEKHLLLVERPPDLVWKRGSIFQKSSATDALVVVNETDWKFFCEEWGGVEEKGISAWVELSSPPGSNSDGSREEIPRIEGDLVILEDINDENETRLPWIRTSQVCEDCIGERESLKLVQKLNYCNEDIYVYLIRGKEAPKSILQASETNSDPDRRVSKRSRKTNSGNQTSLKVSGSTTVYQLKMMIWESLGVVKENQILHKGTRVIDKECATLADMNVFPGDKLWVADSEIHENRDIADELSNEKMDVQHNEGGFHGTLLTANTS